MRFSISLFFSVLLIFIIVNSAGAEMITLNQAVNIALKDSPFLKAFSWSIEGRKEDVNVSKGHMYPRLNIEERFMRTNNPTFGFMAKLNQERFTQADFMISRLNNPDDISDFQTSLTVEQPIFVPNVYIGLGMSRNELEAKNKEYQRKKSEVTLNVLKNFLGVQTAKEYLIAAQKGIEDALEHKRLASLRYDVGTGLYSDMLRGKVEVKKAEAILVKTKGILEVAKRALGLALGRTEAVDTVENRIFLPVNDLSVYLAASLNRNDLKALKLRHANAGDGVKMEKSVFLPEVGFRGSYQMNDHKNPFSPEGESYVLMGFLQWNLFDAARYGKIKKAEAKVNEVAEHLSGLKKRINFRVNEAYIRVKEKEQNLSLSKAALKEAEEALRLVRVRYENSLTSMVDLLDTQVMLQNARAGLVDAESDYISAIAELYYQSGTLLKTLNTLN